MIILIYYSLFDMLFEKNERQYFNFFSVIFFFQIWGTSRHRSLLKKKRNSKLYLWEGNSKRFVQCFRNVRPCVKSSKSDSYGFFAYLQWWYWNGLIGGGKIYRNPGRFGIIEISLCRPDTMSTIFTDSLGRFGVIFSIENRAKIFLTAQPNFLWPIFLWCNFLFR